MASTLDRIPILAQMDKKQRQALVDPLWDNNPIMLQVLGICSSLAVTTQLKTAIVMSIALTVVTACSNAVIAAIRDFIPTKVRIIVQLAVIASLVIVVDQILQAYYFDVAKQLSVFVGLIITNCIVMGRAEGYAMANPPFRSFLDGMGNGLGYSAVLCAVATVREILGKGELLGIRVVPMECYEYGYTNMGLMLLPPGAFIIIGLFVWGHRTITGKVVE